MPSPGYVYILINPSMPGLLKIGKTTNTPEERARELSSHTGVPTPFVVAYSIHTDDCDIGETYVHSILSDRGYRATANREFFTAPLEEAIKVLLSYREERELSIPNYPSSTAQNSTATPQKLFEIEEQIGLSYQNGNDNYLQDYAEALSHYKKAIALGSIHANYLIGQMYENGWGVSENVNTALEYYREGAKKNDIKCWLGLQNLYEFNDELKNEHNLIVCYQNIFMLSSKYIIDFMPRYLRLCRETNYTEAMDVKEHIRPYITRAAQGIMGKISEEDFPFYDMRISKLKDFLMDIQYYFPDKYYLLQRHEAIIKARSEQLIKQRDLWMKSFNDITNDRNNSSKCGYLLSIIAGIIAFCFGYTTQNGGAVLGMIFGIPIALIGAIISTHLSIPSVEDTTQQKYMELAKKN